MTATDTASDLSQGVGVHRRGADPRPPRGADSAADGDAVQAFLPRTCSHRCHSQRRFLGPQDAPPHHGRGREASDGHRSLCGRGLVGGGLGSVVSKNLS